MSFVDNPSGKYLVPKEMSDANVFHRLSGKSLTTFVLPEIEFNLAERITFNVRELRQSAPFTQFTIVSPGYAHANAFGELEPEMFKIVKSRNLVRSNGYVYSRAVTHISISYTEEGMPIVATAAKLTYDDGASVYYSNRLGSTKKAESYESWFLLYRYFQARKHRFLERPVSRQVKRSMGVAKEYREYVLVPRDHIQYKEAMSRADMIRRMRTLHAVRGHMRQEHLRQYANGRIIVVPGSRVRPHTRGEGNALQVRDYKLQS